MELILVTVAGMFIGLCAGMWMPGRDLRGMLLIPGISTITMVLLWEILTWSGLKYGEFLIWGVTFGITIAVSFGSAIFLNDSRKLAESEIGKKR